MIFITHSKKNEIVKITSIPKSTLLYRDSGLLSGFYKAKDSDERIISRSMKLSNILLNFLPLQYPGPSSTTIISMADLLNPVLVLVFICYLAFLFYSYSSSSFLETKNKHFYRIHDFLSKIKSDLSMKNYKKA